MHIDWALALAGAGVGFIVGLTGMGGGALMTPILVLVFGIQPLAAVSSDLVASMIMKPIGGGVHLRRGTVNLHLVKWLVLGSVPSAFASVWVLEHLGDPARVNTIVQYSIGVALLLASVALVAKGAFSGRRRVVGSAHEIQIRPLRTVLIGVFGGVVVGLTSVGSGSLMMILLMLLYPTLAASELVGTDLVQAIPLVAAAAFGHILFGKVQFDVTTSLLVGCIPGVYLGARVSSRSPDHVIRPILAVVLIVSGLKMLKVPTPMVGGIAAALVLGAVVMVLVRRHDGHLAPEGPELDPGLAPDPVPRS
jgi:uncharacterized membrane protein YfcA